MQNTPPLLISGWIRDYVDNTHAAPHDTLVVVDSDRLDDDTDCLPLAKRLLDEIDRCLVTVRYWVSEQKSTIEEAQKGFLDTLFGVAHVHYQHCYSEMTGYLYTNDDLVIGGHDLIGELESHKDKWLNLEIVNHGPAR